MKTVGALFSTVKVVLWNVFSSSKIEEKIKPSFAMMLSQLTIFEVSVKYRSDTSFLLKPFKFSYILLNLFNPASIAIVWFCSFIFIFSLLFLNKFLKLNFFQGSSGKCWLWLNLYSDSFISCRAIMGVCIR